MIKITDNFQVNKPAPIDDRLGPFISTAVALSSIELDRRYIGLTVIVDTGTGATEYWFEDGIQNNNLVAKSTGGGGGFNCADLLTCTDFTTLQTDVSNLQTDILDRVPYTGATQDVDLDNFNLDAKAVKINGTAGSGHVGLKHQSANATAGGQETALFAGSDGELYYKNDGLSVAQIASRAWVNAQGFITNVITALGFTPENVSNKVGNLTASATNYPTVNAVNTGLITRSYSVGTFGSSSITIASTGVANLVTVSGHAFTINEADMPIGTTIQINGVVERTTGTTGNCGISYDVNGVKRYYIINAVTNAHQLQYQFTLYRESSTSIRLIGGSSATPIAMTFGAGNVGTTTATVTGGGNIVFQLSGWGTVVSEVFAFRFFKAILTR